MSETMVCRVRQLSSISTMPISRYTVDSVWTISGIELIHPSGLVDLLALMTSDVKHRLLLLSALNVVLTSHLKSYILGLSRINYMVYKLHVFAQLSSSQIGLTSSRIPDSYRDSHRDDRIELFNQMNGR